MASDDTSTKLHHVNQVPHRTMWENLYKEDCFVLQASPTICFSDHKSRAWWTFLLSIIGSPTGATVTGVVEHTLDGTNYSFLGPNLAAATITANSTTPIVPLFIQGYAACKFPFRPTTVTLGSSEGFRVGCAAA